MICKHCRMAGILNERGDFSEAYAHHTLCPSFKHGVATACDCHHRTGKGWVNEQRSEQVQPPA